MTDEYLRNHLHDLDPVSSQVFYEDDEEDDEHPDSQRLLDRTRGQERSPLPRRRPVSKKRAFFIRALALLCACSLSIGSHYASYILGPLKSRLGREMGTSNTEFSLLISAFSLNSTWTPLLGGILASRLGTTFTSILATGSILAGQILLLIGDITQSVRLMALGMFIFGLGISPLAVVQETIIVRFFKSHGLGVSLALGLVAGKGASFVSARTSYPLTERFGPHAPFYVATFLAALSVAVNLVYVSASKWLVEGSGAELEASDIRSEAQRRSIHSLSEAQALEKVAAKHNVNFREITHLGDVFWAYVGLNVFCGSIWSPFIHLAANIIEQRYSLSELDASNQASYLLAGSIVLYPICGYVVDRLRGRPIVLQLLTLSSCLTMTCYFWLVLPPRWTHSALPAVFSFGLGHGFATLLLVVIVPQIVPLKFVPTALGAHKSLEQTGSTTLQTLAGWVLDTDKKSSPDGPPGNNSAVQHLLNTFLALNVLQLLGVICLSHLDRRQKRLELEAIRRNRNSLLPEHSHREVDHPKDEDRIEDDGWTDDHEPTEPLPSSSEPDQGRPRQNSRVELSHDHSPPRYLLPPTPDRPSFKDTESMKRRIKRGEVFAGICAVLIVFTWVFFLGTAWLRLRSKAERGSSDMNATTSLPS